MGVAGAFASTTMLVVLVGVSQVCVALQSWEGLQPPQVPLQPSGPHVLPVQSAWQFDPGPVLELPAVPVLPPVAALLWAAVAPPARSL